MTIELPTDIIDYILSFGDPEIYVKFSYCFKQLLYNKREFGALRNTIGNTYSGWRDSYFMYFVLERNYQKSLNNNNFYKSRSISCGAYRTQMREFRRRRDNDRDAVMTPSVIMDRMEDLIMFIND